MGAADRLESTREAIRRAALDCGRDPALGHASSASPRPFRPRTWLRCWKRAIAFSGKTACRRLWASGPNCAKNIRTSNCISSARCSRIRRARRSRLFDVIESVDREKIARALSEEIARTGKRPRLFVQVNTGAEPQKAGVLPENADSFLAACRDAYGLKIEGLMCVPPRRRAGLAAFRAARRHRRAQWNRRTLHGHEFGFRTRDPVRGDLCPGRLGDHGRARLSRVRRRPLPDSARMMAGRQRYPINSATLRPSRGRSRAMSRARNATQPAVGERSSVAM